MTVESRSYPRHRTTDRIHAHYAALGKGRGFLRLRRRFASSSLVIATLFLVLYGTYIGMSAFARNVMADRLIGNINVALALGVLQIVATFLIALARSRYSRAALDPLAERLQAEIEGPDRIPRARSGLRGGGTR